MRHRPCCPCCVRVVMVMSDFDGCNHDISFDEWWRLPLAKNGSLLPLIVEKWLHGGHLESRTRLENGNSRNDHHGVKSRQDTPRREHAGSLAGKSCWTKAIPRVHVVCQPMEPKVLPMTVLLFTLAPDIYSCSCTYCVCCELMQQGNEPQWDE